MNTLDKKATEILENMLAMNCSRIDKSNGAYMPVHIEVIERNKDYRLISLAHYGELNGDLMRDPEMIFAQLAATDEVIPYYYRNDYLGIEQYSMRWTGEGIKINRSLQTDHTVFANQWLRNIAEQQGL